MKKIHTRAKKKLRLGTHTQHKARLFGWGKKKGAKTFKTEESANNYAKENNITKFELKKVKKNKKFQIMELNE
jgi:hypothetical protein